MKKVTIYLTSWCPYCVRAKQFLKNKGVLYEEIDLTNDYEGINKIKEKTGHQSVPVIFIGEQFIGGCDDLLMLETSGKLELMLKD